MIADDGPLVATDEYFSHQIVETHARVAQADRSWTEKVCAMAAARDGSLQVAFGVGKYTNRNVFDGYAGISRGKEQWTVRGSRRSSDAPDRIGVGPIDYEVLEPHRRVRFSCAANAEVPVAFEWTFDAVVPPVLEQRDRQRARHGTRLDIEVLRYHQIGLPSGWVDVDGARTEITPETWFTTRDHSWGIRQDVGLPVTDIEGARRGEALPEGVSFRFSWSPMLLQRRDSSMYAIHHQHRLIARVRLRGDHGRRRCRAPRRSGRAVRGPAAGSPLRPGQPAGARRHPALHDGRRIRGPSPSKPSATPDFTWAAASTSVSTGTTTANGAEPSTSTVSTWPTAPTRRRRGAFTRSATPSCGSRIRSAAGGAGATSRRRSQAPGPRRVSTRAARSYDIQPRGHRKLRRARLLRRARTPAPRGTRMRVRTELVDGRPLRRRAAP